MLPVMFRLPMEFTGSNQLDTESLLLPLLKSEECRPEIVYEKEIGSRSIRRLHLFHIPCT